MRGSFGNILTHFKNIQFRGPPQGYSPEPTKSILVVASRNVTIPEEFFWGTRMMMFTRSQYFGGFIGDWDAETTWLDEKVQG